MVLRTLNEALIAYTVGCSLTELSPYPLTFYDSKATNVLRFIDSHTVHLLKCAVWFSLAYLQCCLTIITTVSYRHKNACSYWQPLPCSLSTVSSWFTRQPQIYFLFQRLGLN